jgi:RNA polymerase sigma factor (sigma-70 family)
MNLENFKQLAIALYENHEKIEYFTFLESIRKSSTNDDTKAILESVTQGFAALYEVELDGEDKDNEEVDAAPSAEEAQQPTAGAEHSVPPGFRDYVKLTDKLKAGTIAKFKAGAPAETEKMMKIIKEGKGRLNAKTLNKFKNFSVITDYQYIPDEPSTEQDVANAKSILISSVLPHYVYQGVQIGRTEAYQEAGHDFIVDALNGGYGTPPVTERLQRFIEAWKPGSTFFGWEKRGLGNLKKHAIATSEGTTVTSKVWNAEKPYAQGDVVNHGRKNWKAVQEVPAGMEPGKDNNFWTPLEKKLDEISTDAPVGAGGDEDDTISVGDTIKSEHNTAEETEAKATVSKMLDKLPHNEKFDKIRRMLDMYFKEGKNYEEIGKEYNVSKARVEQLFKEVYGMMRGQEKQAA